MTPSTRRSCRQSRRNVKNRIFDWQTEFLPLVNLGNAQVEGFQLVTARLAPTIRRNNETQISERDATVSGSQEESDAAGKGSEMAHQMALAAKVLKSDMESILCSRQQRVDGNNSGPVARTTEAFSHWLGRAVDKNSNPAAAVARRHRHHRPADHPGAAPPATVHSRRRERQ